MGRVMLQRRTDEEWDLLVAMHRGYYPLVDNQVFRRFGPPSTEPGPDGRPPDNRHPMDKALAHLKSAFPFTTPEWSAWSATMRSPRIDGTLDPERLRARRGPGLRHGDDHREAASPDEFTTRRRTRYARSGRTVTRSGPRDRLHRLPVARPHDGRRRRQDVAPRSDVGRSRLAVDRRPLVHRRATTSSASTSRSAAQGREPVVTGARSAVAQARRDGADRARSSARTSRRRSRPRDVDFGRGVTVARVVSATPGLRHGRGRRRGRRADRRARPVRRRRAQAGALVVYDKIDYDQGDAGLEHGARRRRGVSEDVRAVRSRRLYRTAPTASPTRRTTSRSAPWTRPGRIEEYTATFDDDDVKFVGEIDATSGLFTPALDGPNPERSGNRNNVGDVWVVADAHAARWRRAAARPRASRRHRPALHAVGLLHGRWPMSLLQPGDCHAFEAGGRRFLYLAPSAAVMAVDDVSAAVLDAVAERPRSPEDVVAAAGRTDSPRRDVDETHRRAGARPRARPRRGAGAADAEDPAAHAGAAQHDGAERHQPVQSELHLLLRVRRRQDRPDRERPPAEVDERGDGARERRLPAARVGHEPRT